MKKIGILALRDESVGGIYQYTQSLVDALKDDETHKYIIFVLQNDHRFDNYGLEIRRLELQGSSIGKKILRLIQFLFFIRKPFLFTDTELKNFEDIDLFLSPEVGSYPHYFINKPYICTFHDMQEQYYPEFFSIKERFERYVVFRAVSKYVKNILCESNFVKNDLIKYLAIEEKQISVIQAPPPKEFIDYEFKNEFFDKVRQKYNLPEKYIFYPAQCWFHKNHIRLVEAFRKVVDENDEIYLVLTGSQQNNYSNLIKRIDELELNDKVKHLGYIDYLDLPYLYKMSEMLVMPTLFESVSIPIYEAFALKVPVCSSNVVALPEQVREAGILFDPLDINDMATKILMYLKDEKLRKANAEIGFEKVKNFNHEQYRRKLVEILDH